MPKVSVCIPVYNVEQYIGRCIESVQSQSLKDVEIIIVDDCSPDRSMEIVRRYAKKDSRIKEIEHNENHGLMVARCTGYMAAKGDYITFLDSDDTLAEGALESLVSAAIKENADIVSGTIKYIPNNRVPYLWPNKLQYGTDKISMYKSMLLDECGHNLCSRLFRRELLQDHQYETFEKATNGEDGILFYQVVDNAKKIVAVDHVVYEYYQNISSSSNVRLTERALSCIALGNLFRVKTAGKYEELRKLVFRKNSRTFWTLKSYGYPVDYIYHSVGLVAYSNCWMMLKMNGLYDAAEIFLKYLISRLLSPKM